MNVKGQLYWFRVLSRSARVVAVSAICMMGIGCASSIPPPPMKERGSIGAVDPERILKETKAGKDATELLNAFMKDRQALLELEQKELRRLEEEIMTQGSVL